MPKDVDKYVCDICQEAFGNSFNLHRHVISNHSDKRINSCPYCKKGFSRKDNLKTHITSKHATFINTKTKPSVSIK